MISTNCFSVCAMPPEPSASRTGVSMVAAMVAVCRSLVPAAPWIPGSRRNPAACIAAAIGSMPGKPAARTSMVTWLKSGPSASALAASPDTAATACKVLRFSAGPGRLISTSAKCVANASASTASSPPAFSAFWIRPRNRTWSAAAICSRQSSRISAATSAG